MENTSPRHMPVLGTVHPIKIDRATQEVPMKYLEKIVQLVLELYAIELLGSMSTDEAWCHLRYVTFLSGVHWPTGSMYTQVVRIRWILQ